MGSSKGLVGVIVLNWNGWEDTLKCLESLWHHDYPELRVLVVDNGSTNDSARHISNWLVAHPNESGRDFSLLVNSENIGFSGGNNFGLKKFFDQGSLPQYVMFLNNDCLLHQGCIYALVLAASSKKVAVAALQLVDGKPSYSIHKARWPKLVSALSPLLRWNDNIDENESIVDCDWISGAAVLFPKEVIEYLCGERDKLWREDYFLYCEDVELSMRMREQGIRLIVVTSAMVDHAISSSSSGSESSYYYMARNRFHICRDCYGVFGRWLCMFSVGIIGVFRSFKWRLNGKVARGNAFGLGTLHGIKGKRGKISDSDLVRLDKR